MRLLSLSVLTLLIASGAVAQDASRLVGDWSLVSVTEDGETVTVPDETPMTWSFYDDGTVSIELGIVAGAGTYSIQDGLLVIVLKGEVASFEMQAEPDRLVLDLDGMALAFSRIDDAPPPSSTHP